MRVAAQRAVGGMVKEHQPIGRRIQIATDGSCLMNPHGPGGWAVVLVWGDRTIERVGGNSCTTNNRMEMQAVIAAYHFVSQEGLLADEFEVLSDSQLTVLCGVGRWRRRANRDLWAQLDEVAPPELLRQTLRWVKGHAGHPLNERADALARAAAEQSRSARQTSEQL